MVKFYMISQKSEILHFDGFLMSQSYKVSAKKYSYEEELSLMTLKRDAKFEGKWLVVSTMTLEFGEFSPNHLKAENSFQWTFFIQSTEGLNYKKAGELSFMTLKSDAKFE